MSDKFAKTHYVCTGGCEGVSDKPGVCNTEGCADYQHPLKACNCTDGRHTEAFVKADKELMDGICKEPEEEV